jgi:HD-GYP domain-containing protein (c-di-GMP phosphodiesterase class II)
MLQEELSTLMVIKQRLWHWLLKPSSNIKEPDQRRQASLLSAFLLVILLLAVLVESLTVALISSSGYTGYRQTIIGIILVLLIYGISRTRHIQIAAVLSVVGVSLLIFVSGWAQPSGILGGMFNFLILPLWLGSLYLRMRAVILLTVIDMFLMLASPLFISSVTYTEILIGPVSFLFVTAILLMVLTRHRNGLEQDRRAQLAEKEERSRTEAARANSLLRVAEHLNAQLDLDTLLKSICEEATVALNTPVSLVALYDPKLHALRPTTGVGIPPEVIKSMAPVPLPSAGEQRQRLGTLNGLHDLQNSAPDPNAELFQLLDLHSLAFAIMEHEDEIVGGLAAISKLEDRLFSEEELLLLQGLARQAALAIVNTRLFKEARRRMEHLQALRTIDLAIASNHDIRQTLEVLLNEITTQLGVDAAVILLTNEKMGQLEYGAGRGFQTLTLRFTRLRIGEGIAGRAAQQHKIVHIPDLQTDPQTLIFAPALAQEGFVSYYAAPLIAQGKVQGVLEIFHRSLLEPDAEWLAFLEALAGQAAIAIDNTSLLQDLHRTNDELSEAYESTIEGWSHALDLRDKETEGHTRRVTELTLELARTFGFSEAELVHIRRGALLHDIGKMGVPDSILLKEGPLTREEWDVMHKHPGFAREMLLPISYLRPALDIPYCHHEKWDGSGYPRGLKGEEIPLTARIFAVVDVWDALTSDRPYRPAWSREKTLAYILEGSGSHFDPQVVDSFLTLLHEKSLETEKTH